jgi:hypothetical protein
MWVLSALLFLACLTWFIYESLVAIHISVERGLTSAMAMALSAWVLTAMVT